MSAPAKTRVCPRCPPGTPAKPLDIRFWHYAPRSKVAFSTICAACVRASANASRRRNIGRPNGFAQAAYPGIETPSDWIVRRGDRELVFRCESLTPHGGIRASGHFVGSCKRTTLRASWLVQHGRRVVERHDATERTST